MKSCCLVVILTLVHRVTPGEKKGSHVTEVELGMLTHVVLLDSKAGPCSGSIISEEYVLTAAHCLVSITARKIFGHYETFSMEQVAHDGVKITAGIVELGDEGKEHQQDRTSKEIILHPQFYPMKLAGFDIGLIRVSPPFEFSDVVFQMEISEKGWPQSQKENKWVTCQSSGFGDMSQPQLVKLRMWDVKALHGDLSCPCTKRFQWKRMVCTMPDQPDLCSGDSGAALICQDKIVAISHMIRDHKTCEKLDYPHNCTSNTLNTFMYLCPFNNWIRLFVPKVPPTPQSCLAPPSQHKRQLSFFIVLYIFAVCIVKLY